jgi:hypothetical protein
MMRDIYANAGSVLVWLDRPSRLTSMTFQVLELLAFVWIERLHRDMEAEGPLPSILLQCPNGSMFLSSSDKTWSALSGGYHKTVPDSSAPQDS